MITYEEFEKLADSVSGYLEVIRHVEPPTDFYRTINFTDIEGTFWTVTWFKNSLTFSPNKNAYIYVEGNPNVEIIGTWPNRSKLNIQISIKDQTYIIIPIQNY